MFVKGYLSKGYISMELNIAEEIKLVWINHDEQLLNILIDGNSSQKHSI